MGLTVGISPQEAFPQEDLTPDNAALLSLMLANRGIMSASHAQAELNCDAYRIGHPILRSVADHLSGATGDDAKRAFDFGITAFEAMAALVRTRPPEQHGLYVVLANVSEGQEPFGYLVEADANFRNFRPNARGAVEDVAMRYHPETVRYAAYGAALACQTELDLVHRAR